MDMRQPGRLLFLAWVGLAGCNSNYFNRPKVESSHAANVTSPNLPGAPAVPPRSILRPYLQTTLGGIEAGRAAGTAFSVKVNKDADPVVLTALSLLGTDSGFSRRPESTELNEIHQSITLGDAFGEFDGVLEADNFIEIPESNYRDRDSLAGDILVLRMPRNSRVGCFRLSVAQPAIGEKVWLSAALFRGAPPSQLQHEAIVDPASDSDELCYRFTNESISFEGTLGGPILNDKGEVVAVHLHGETVEGNLIGIGNPTSRFLSYLLKALSSDAEIEDPSRG